MNQLKISNATSNGGFRLLPNKDNEPKTTKFTFLFNKKGTQKIPPAQKDFLGKAMVDLFADGKFGFVLGDGQASAGAFVAQAFIQNKNKKPLVYVGTQKDYQEFLLDIASFYAMARISSEEEFLKLPAYKQEFVEKCLENVDVESVEGEITIQALGEILKKKFSQKIGGHFICKITADVLTQSFDVACLKHVLGGKISGTFVCDQPWVVHRGPSDRKSNIFSGLQTAVLEPSDRENVKKLHIIANVGKIICLRAGRVQRRSGLKHCLEFAKTAKKKHQAFVVEFFDEKNLQSADKVAERKMFCWYSHNKARFSENKPEGQTFLPAIWSGIA